MALHTDFSDIYNFFFLSYSVFLNYMRWKFVHTLIKGHPVLVLVEIHDLIRQQIDTLFYFYENRTLSACRNTILI